MSITTTGILGLRLEETPVAVIDFETTGLSAGYDRAVELAVVRVEPGCAPRVVFDSLINPGRPMAATEIHGITDHDVRNAPTFSEILDELLPALAGCVVAAHNATFDMRFLCFELGLPASLIPIPFVCTRYCRALIGRKPAGLESACRSDGIPFRATHASKADALATALLWASYQADFERLGLHTFESLTRQGKSYKFLQSFRFPPLDAPVPSGGASRQRPRPPFRPH